MLSGVLFSGCLILMGLIGWLMGYFLNCLIIQLPLMMMVDPGSVSLDSGSIHQVLPRWQGLLVNISASLVAIIVPVIGGLTWVSGVLVIGCWWLLTLSVIDWRTYLLPDLLTLSLLWFGLLLNSLDLFVPLREAVYGAVAGYIVFWLVSTAYRCFFKKEGLGLGDAKLTAALGAWVGVMMVPWLIALASCLALLFIVCQRCSGMGRSSRYLPLGPFLSLVGAVLLVRLSYWYRLLDAFF